MLVSASAVGYYGFSGNGRTLGEESPPSPDFLGQLCVDWEREARRVERPWTRVVLVRAGLVLERDGGPLARMLLLFRLFAGGPIGSGRQYVSWIHRLDWLELIRWVVEQPDLSGPINATAPVPVTNAEFSRALGRALGRPSWMPAPAFMLRLALGEMADALVIGGQRVVPKRSRELGDPLLDLPFLVVNRYLLGQSQAQNNCQPNEPAKNHDQKRLNGMHAAPPSFFGQMITCEIVRSGQTGIEKVSRFGFQVQELVSRKVAKNAKGNLGGLCALA